jgi:hypothetical protein
MTRGFTVPPASVAATTKRFDSLRLSITMDGLTSFPNTGVGSIGFPGRKVWDRAIGDRSNPMTIRVIRIVQEGAKWVRFVFKGKNDAFLIGKCLCVTGRPTIYNMKLTG